MSDTKHTPPYPMPFNWPEVDAVTYSTPEAAEQAMKRMAEWQATYDALLAALEAAPFPPLGGDEAMSAADAYCWIMEEFMPWYNGPRVAALAKVKP